MDIPSLLGYTDITSVLECMDIPSILEKVDIQWVPGYIRDSASTRIYVYYASTRIVADKTERRQKKKKDQTKK